MDDCNIPSSSSSSSTLSLSTTTITQSNNHNNNPPIIQTMQHNDPLSLELLLDTWDEKSVHYWFSIVLIQGVIQLPLCDLRQCTLVCKSISKLVRDHIQRNFWFRQHETYSYYYILNGFKTSDDPEKRYLWYSPCNIKDVKNVSTLPIHTTKIQFFPTFDSLFTFPLHLQQVTHITFGNNFNQRIGCGIKSEINNLPLTLTHLEFSTCFDQPVSDLPPNLTFLSLGWSFDHRVDHVLPPKLTHLSFNHRFNDHVDHLPPNLTFLSLSFKFSKPIEHLPHTLTHLTLLGVFNYPIDKLPLSLTHLTIANIYRVYFDQPLHQLQRNFESNLEYLVLSKYLVQMYESSIPPNFIRLDESEQYYNHIVYKKQQQQQRQQQQQK